MQRLPIFQAGYGIVSIVAFILLLRAVVMVMHTILNLIPAVLRAVGVGG